MKFVKVGEPQEPLLTEVTKFANSHDSIGRRDFVELETKFKAWADEMKNKFCEYIFRNWCKTSIQYIPKTFEKYEEYCLEAVKEENIRYACDVFKGEPEAKSGDVLSKLQNNPNIYVTHHIGASTEQAQDAVPQKQQPLPLIRCPL